MLPPRRETYSATLHLAGGILGAHEPGRCLVAALRAYFDPSGHETDPRIVMGGVISDLDSWGDFDKEWKEALGPIERFHHTDFKASKGEFAEWEKDEPKRRDFLGKLLKVFDERVVGWFEVSILPSDFHIVNTRYKLDPPLGGPYMLTCATAHTQVANWARANRPGEPVTYYFAKGDPGQRPYARIEDIGPDVFGVDEYVPDRGWLYPLQAADLIAGERQTLYEGLEAEDWLRMRRYPMKKLMPKKLEWSGLTLDTLLHICESLPGVFPRR